MARTSNRPRGNGKVFSRRLGIRVSRWSLDSASSRNNLGLVNIHKPEFSLAAGTSNPKVLTTVVILLGIGLLCVSTILAFVLGTNHKTGDGANNGRAALAASQPAHGANEADAKLLQEQLRQLTESLTNSIAELKAAREKLQTYETAEQERQKTPLVTKQAARVETQTTAPTKRRIQVYEILADFGFKKCSTQIGTLGIKNLPQEIGQYLAKVKQMRADYARFTDTVEQQDRDARLANATALTSAGGNATYVDAAMAERRTANIMMENARDAKVALLKYKASLTSWENAAEEQTTIFAVETSQIYGGVQVWAFTGMAGTLADGGSQ